MSKSFVEIALEDMNKDERTLAAVARKVIFSKPYGKHLKVVENEIRDSVKGTDDFARPHEVVANGNCAICGKPLIGDRVFICEECSKKGADGE